MNIQTIRENTYFKGGPENKFMSGRWIGNELQENVLFIMCDFNRVEATFKNCVFIDCSNPPKGENCLQLNLPPNVRLSLEYKQDNEQWA